MKHLFVTYAIALMLKEAKFNEPCIAGYDEWTEEGEEVQLKAIVNEFGILSGITPQHLAYTICAPSYQQVIDWILEKHNANITVHKEFEGKWYWRVVDIKDYTDVNSQSIYDTKEGCLVNAIENFIEVGVLNKKFN